MADSQSTPLETRATGTIDERDDLMGLRGYYTLLRDYDFEAYADDDVYVVLADLDDFRLINDAYGDNRGNEILANVGQVIKTAFGDRRTFRYGSDEFLIVNSFYDEDAFLEKIDALDRRIDHIECAGTHLHLTLSYGYVHGKVGTSDDLHEAIRMADRKMYEAKRLGKARAVGMSLEDDPIAGSIHHDAFHKSYETDELTGLGNLIFFRSQLSHLLGQQRGKDVPETERDALVYFNVQNFKGYNQKFGFEAGDELLLLIAAAIEEAFPGCLAARLSADQFMVAAKAGVVENGIKAVRTAFRKKQKDGSIWLKAGIYLPSDDDDNMGVNMDRAKLACDSIRGRRDVYFRYYDDELQSQILAHRYVLDNFDRALREGWIRAFYQPIVRVATGEVCDTEVLTRWVDPERGIISPIEFIPVLEEARLIHKLDLYVIRQACETVVAANANGYTDIPISVNLSRLDFELCDIVEEVDAIVRETGINRKLVSVEVTESALTDNQEFLKDEVDRFRERGFEVWMDDFGSGYSSLNVLKDYNFDLVKIDMAFLRGFETNELTRVVLAHIVGMAKELGLKTLVEGVETEEQHQFLRSVGCGRAQGYHFGRPMSADDTWGAVDAGTFLPIEEPALHDFYEEVGRVNLLRPRPTPPVDGHYVPSDAPAALLVREAGKIRYLNLSTTYPEVLTTMGVSGIEESTEQMNTVGSPEHAWMNGMVDAALASGGWERSTFENDTDRVTISVRAIATDPERDLVAFMSVVSH